MSCFPCFGGGKKDKKDSSSDDDDHPNHAPGVVHKKAGEILISLCLFANDHVFDINVL